MFCESLDRIFECIIGADVLTVCQISFYRFCLWLQYSMYFTFFLFFWQCLFQGTSGSVRILAPPKFMLRQDTSGRVTVRKYVKHLMSSLFLCCFKANMEYLLSERMFSARFSSSTFWETFYQSGQSVFLFLNCSMTRKF